MSLESILIGPNNTMRLIYLPSKRKGTLYDRLELLSKVVMGRVAFIVWPSTRREEGGYPQRFAPAGPVQKCLRRMIQRCRAGTLTNEQRSGRPKNRQPQGLGFFGLVALSLGPADGSYVSRPTSAVRSTSSLGSAPPSQTSPSATHGCF